MQIIPQHIKQKVAKHRAHIAELEKNFLLEILNDCFHNVTLAAKTLGVDRRTMYNFFKKYGIKF